LGTTETDLYFTDGTHHLVVEKVPDVIPQSSKDMFKDIDKHLTQVSLQNLVGITQVLSASSFEGGILDLNIFGDGVKIFSKAKDGTRLSNFTLGMPDGEFKTITVSVAAVKSTLTLFKGSMNLSVGVKEDVSVMKAGNIIALIAGRQD